MESVNKLAELFQKFPGIGPRQSLRFVYFLLTRSSSFREELARLITDLKRQIIICAFCKRFFTVNKNAGLRTLCYICLDTERVSDLLLVVEKDVDLENVEKSGAYHGRYFVLGGTVPFVGKNKLSQSFDRVDELVALVEKLAVSGGLKEVILAFSATSEGEHTASEIRGFIAPLAQRQGFRISNLGRGLSTGLELEYSDALTLKSALDNRK